MTGKYKYIHPYCLKIDTAQPEIQTARCLHIPNNNLPNSIIKYPLALILQLYHSKKPNSVIKRIE